VLADGTGECWPMSSALRLPEHVTLQTITPVHEALCATLAQSGDVVLDASELVEGDLGLIQLLCAAKAQAHSEARGFCIVPPDHSALAVLMDRVGLAPDFFKITPLA
jgi:hypothetical protein